MVPDVVRPVIGDIQIQGSIPIDVRQRHADAAVGTGGSGRAGKVFELPMPVVQKTLHAAPGPGHQQIEETIPIDVREHRSPAELVRANNARFPCDILETPAAQILVKRVVAVQAAKINIRQAVVVVIADCDT